MTAIEVVKGRWYPNSAPTLPGETPETWTNRVLGADGPDGRPYDHGRNRQCSIGWHNECSDRQNYGAIDKTAGCGCPCHEERLRAPELVAEFNKRVQVGAVVSFIEGSTEPPVKTTSVAYVEQEGQDRGWPVVELDTFPHPVWLSWLVIS